MRSCGFLASLSGSLSAIDERTLSLYQAASEGSGDYDGWDASDQVAVDLIWEDLATMHKTGAATLAPAMILTLVACGPGSLRGSLEASDDGGTYLVIADDNGGGCDAIKVDGKVWPLALERAGPISPGPHVVECSAENAAAGIPIVIPEGMVFTFDYWGP